MQVCYDTLEDMRWISSRGCWRKRGQGIDYLESKEPCLNCGLPFLYQKGSKGKFCCGWCRSRFLHKTRPDWATRRNPNKPEET
jgi:hypothetical protein